MKMGEKRRTRRSERRIRRMKLIWRRMRCKKEEWGEE